MTLEWCNFNLVLFIFLQKQFESHPPINATLAYLKNWITLYILEIECVKKCSSFYQTVLTFLLYLCQFSTFFLSVDHIRFEVYIIILLKIYIKKVIDETIVAKKC